MFGNCPNEACGLPNAGWPGGGTLRLGVIDAAVGLLREVVALPEEVPAPADRAAGLPRAPVCSNWFIKAKALSLIPGLWTSPA